MTFRNIQETGKPLAIKDEGVTIADNTDSIDFTGAGVSGSAVGQDVTESISGASLSFSDAETPSGSVNGSNVTFTLANSPSPATSLSLYVNGALQTPGGEDYSLSGATITMVNAPLTGSIIRAWYRY